MTESIIGNSDNHALRGDVAALKDDVGRLIAHIKGGATRSVRRRSIQRAGSRPLSESLRAGGTLGRGVRHMGRGGAGARGLDRARRRLCRREGAFALNA